MFTGYRREAFDTMLIVDSIDSDDKAVVLFDLASRKKTVLANGLHPSVLWERH